MEENKVYYAFISYKREDEKWAKWLQDKLEHYRFPTNLNGRTDLPKNIRPTFRDVTDLNPGLLAEEIDNALRNSEWLIVVCSPRSAKSPWVCKEAQTFINLGRADHIIPFVIEGNPFSNDPTTECYPEALLNLTGSKELLAANINEMGRDAAAIKVVARMFNLRFDAIWQRYEREQRRKRWMWRVGSVFLALLGLGIGGYFVEQKRTIERQKDRLEQDSVVMANHLMRIQGDSIQLSAQNDSILNQNILIQNQRDSLEFSNKLLAKERDNVLKANWRMQVNLFRYLAKELRILISQGDLTTAQLLVSEIFPDNLIHPNKPFVEEVGAVLRAINDSINSPLYNLSNYRRATDFLDDGQAAINENQLLAYVSQDKSISVIDITTNQIIDEIENDRPIRGICFRANSDSLLGFGPKYLKIWNARTGNLVKQHNISNVPYWAFIHPNLEQVLTGAPDDSICVVYDYNSGKEIHRINLHTEAFFPSISNEGNLIACAILNDLFVYDYLSGKRIKSVRAKGPNHLFFGGAFSPDDRCFATITMKKNIPIYDVETWEEIDSIQTQGDVVDLLYDKYNGNFLVYLECLRSKEDVLPYLCKYDIKKRKIILKHRLNGNSNSMFGNSQIVGTLGKNTITLYKFKYNDWPKNFMFNSVIDKELIIDTDVTDNCCFSSDGKMFAIKTDSLIKIVDADNCKVRHIYKCFDHVTCMQFSQDNKELVFATESEVLIINLNDFRIQSFPLPHTNTIFNKVSSLFLDSSYLMRYIFTDVNKESILCLWDISEKKEVFRDTIRGLEYLNDPPIRKNGKSYIWAEKYNSGELIVQGSNGLKWNDKCDSKNNGFSWSYNGDYLALFKHSSICIRRIDGKIVKNIPLPADNFENEYISFSQDNKFLLSIRGGQLDVWDIKSGKSIYRYVGNCLKAMFLKDEKCIKVLEKDKYTKLPFPPLQQLIDETRERLKNRRLTQEERRKYYLE